MRIDANKEMMDITTINSIRVNPPWFWFVFLCFIKKYCKSCGLTVLPPFIYKPSFLTKKIDPKDLAEQVYDRKQNIV